MMLDHLLECMRFPRSPLTRSLVLDLWIAGTFSVVAIDGDVMVAFGDLNGLKETAH